MPLDRADLKLAYITIRAKQPAYDRLWAYYDGDHPLIYSAERLRQIFKRIDARFQENWCAVVVDSALDRINLKSFTVTGDEALTTRLNDLWTATEMSLDSEDAHTAALVAGEAFVVAWRDDETGEIECCYNDPRLCHIFYDTENPRRKRFAAKLWVDDEGFFRLTLYYSDRFEYFVSTRKADGLPAREGHKSFVEAQPAGAPNPYGVIPVFHLRRERRTTKSELANVIPPQDATNKLLADMMVSAEFGAFRQRYIVSHADGLTLKNAPNEVWDIPAGDGEGERTQVGELSTTDLGNYLTAIDQRVASISAISRTPKHYFYQGAAAQISGDALIALEAPLNHKVQMYIERFSVTWQETAAFLLLLDGAQVARAAISAVYDPPRTVQPLAQAQTREINLRTGIALSTNLRAEGWTEAEIEANDEAKQDEQDAEQARMGNVGEMLLTQFDRGQGRGQNVMNLQTRNNAAPGA